MHRWSTEILKSLEIDVLFGGNTCQNYYLADVIVMLSVECGTYWTSETSRVLQSYLYLVSLT